MRTILVMSGREFTARLRDRTALLVIVLAPVVLASLFSFALGRADPPAGGVLGVVNLDGGEASTQVIDEVAKSPELAAVIKLRRLPSEQAAEQALKTGEIGAAVVFPADFSRNVERAGGQSLRVLSPAEGARGGVAAKGVVDRVSAAVYARTLATKVAVLGDVAEDEAKGLAESHHVPMAGLTLTTQTMPGGSSVAAAYYGPGMALLFGFFAVAAAARSLLAERRLGTLARIRATPVSPLAVVAAKGLVGFVFALLSMVTTWASSALLFGADWGEPVAVVALLTVFALAATGITMALVSGPRTGGETEGSLLVTAFTFAILGGNMVSLYQMPEFMQWVSLLTPNGWATRGFSILTAGEGGLADLGAPLAVLAVIALFFAGMVVVRFRRGLT
ncbi:ABC transporter permease [Nonomuraea sp. K274]|uniref:ABC transporter permease n=1 Tax=Nonomuraea cypriaca TaxID=1187855 RepID=A0A931F096_9ACTN|nr:ABC transporter permease [Nonomuraea cypriaca]MBF8186921.1 ABC transporter permease [Nonomuraea cypriaca]